MAVKKQTKEVLKQVKSKPTFTVKIPKHVSSCTNKVWRKAMIKAIQSNAMFNKTKTTHSNVKDVE
jgi:hypothetical protein